MSSNRLVLLFDLDGTMVDTDALHLGAWNAVLSSFDRAIDSVFYKTRVMGFDTESVTSALFPEQDAMARMRLAAAKESAFRARISQLEPTPGLAELLDWAEAKQLGMAVVTNAPRENASFMLAALGWASRFPILVIGEELERGKPDPLPYTTALTRLGASAIAAVAFEDSLSGVRSAVAAEVPTVGVRTALSDATLRATGAFMTIADFTDPALRELLQQRAS